jgi:nucleotidyltransferase substrate binding protein (TIGR01987 family)
MSTSPTDKKSDIRWQQRLAHFGQALEQLGEAVALRQQRPLSRLERQGLIKAFEFTHELAWNTLKDFFEYQGTSGLMGSRDATREAFRVGLIEDGDVWMEMIASRNRTAHTYNENAAEEIAGRVSDAYLPLFLKLQSRLHTRLEADHDE